MYATIRKPRKLPADEGIKNLPQELSPRLVRPASLARTSELLVGTVQANRAADHQAMEAQPAFRERNRASKRIDEVEPVTVLANVPADPTRKPDHSKP